MADEPNAPEQSETDQPATEPEPQQPDIPAEVKAALKKANKEAETLRLKLKEYEDRDKTEQQRLIERAEAAEKEAEGQRLALARYRVGLSKGLPPELVERLQGSNEEELLADADSLLSLIPKQAAPARGAVDQGPRDGTITGPSINDLIRAAAKSR